LEQQHWTDVRADGPPKIFPALPAFCQPPTLPVRQKAALLPKILLAMGVFATLSRHFVISSFRHFIRRQPSTVCRQPSTASRWALRLVALFIIHHSSFIINAEAQTTSQTSFGKNRVQYHRQFDDWMLYETANFVTYWYGDARNVAQSALQTAELDYPEVQQLLEHQMSEKIEMLVFSDLTDLKQSNIGEDELLQLRVGETKVVGNKVFCYFDGNHQHLRAQIREGMAGVMINSMLFGSNLQEIVQNAVLLNLPGWYVNGLAAYCGEDWNTQLDNQLRDLLATQQFKNFDKFAKNNPRLAGHAFWNYIALQFGRGTVSNLLYLTRINRSMDAGFLYVLGNGYRRTTETMLEHYRKTYREEAKTMRQPDEAGLVQVKNKRKLPLYQVRLSPDGKRIAWASNDIGRWRVYVQDLATGKRKRVMRGGSRNALQATDYNYPKICWNPDNQRLAVLFERRDVPKLALLDLDKGKKEVKEISPEFQRVYSMDFASPSEIVFSAMVKGYADLFVYRTVSRQTERLTQDFWDDLDAKVVTLDGRKGILFASNRLTDTLSPQRLDTILPLGHFDLFFYDYENRSPELVRITDTPLADERSPIALDSAHFAYLSDESGVHNRQTGYMEPYIAYHQAVIYLRDGSDAKALDTRQPGDWPLERALRYLAPLDTVLKNLDSTKIDSIRFQPVFKKRPRTWNLSNYDRDILEQHSTTRANRFTETIQRNGKTSFFVRKIEAQPADTLELRTPNSELRTLNSKPPSASPSTASEPCMKRVCLCRRSPTFCPLKTHSDHLTLQRPTIQMTRTMARQYPASSAVIRCAASSRAGCSKCPTTSCPPNR